MVIPYVSVASANGSVRGACGYALASIQLEDASANRHERLGKARQCGARLLDLLCRIEDPVTIELHICTHPSLDGATPGKATIAIRLTVEADSEAMAVERCLKASVLLETLLDTLWDWAEFRTVRNAGEFQKLSQPFTPLSCLWIRRRNAVVPLACPFESETKPVGFQASPLSPGAPSDGAIGISHTFPWNACSQDWSAVLSVLLSYPVPQWIVVRMANRANCIEEIQSLETTVATCEQFLACAPRNLTALAQQASDLRDLSASRLAQLRKHAVRGAVLLLSPGPSDRAIAALVGQSISPDQAAHDSSNFFAGGFQVEPAEPSSAMRGDLIEPRAFTCEEAACAFHLPVVFDGEHLGLPVRKYRTLRASFPRNWPAQEQGLTLLGLNRHRGWEQPIYLPLEDRLRHVFLLGMTGVGKSREMESFFLQDIRAGHGACLIDPHGDLADDILSRFPEERSEDLILVDLGDREWIVPLNLLEWSTEEERDLLIDELYGAVDRLYDLRQVGGPIFEQHFRAMLRLLMGDCRTQDYTPTLLEFREVYQNAAFRKFLLKRTEAEEISDFINELSKTTGECSMSNMAAYVTSKFSRFFYDSQLSRIVGHGEMLLNFPQIMQEGKIVIVKLAAGRFGTNVSNLIASQVVSRFRIAAMSRSSLPPEQRRPFFVYVDEFHHLADHTFIQLLSASRKYGLGLVLANQYAAQLQKSENILSAVLGNVGAILAYRVGAEDAERLQRVFAPMVTAQDLIECPNWQGYIRLHASQSPISPFSFHNCPDSTVPNYERSRELAKVSKERWAVPATEADQMIKARRRLIRSLNSSMSDQN